MLRPEQMSKVSVTGAKAVMPDVIETVHDLNLLHLSDYEGQFDGFETGDPAEGANEASEKLVTVRSLESTLDVTEEQAGPTRIVDDDELDERLEEIRVTVNDLDDRRSALRDDLRSVEERIDAADPLVDLGIDLDLLSGYDSLNVAVGVGDAEQVEEAIVRADGVDAYEVFAGDRSVAAFVRPAEGFDDPLDEALVGADFAAVEVPDEGGDPAAYVDSLEGERESLEADLEQIEADLDALASEHAGFLLAAEERLSIQVEKTEAPLSFATTERAFVADGWIPTESYAAFASALRQSLGDRVEVEELERATYTPTHGHSHEAVGEDADGASGHGGEAVADGGHVVGNERPPTIQENPSGVKPFELLVQTINRPLYFEIDPTVILFLTFPAFYGFMIGDLGYGILYAGIGYWLYSRFDSAAFKSLGGIAMWAGVFTTLFGILYGEIFGLHLITEHLWVGALGFEDAPIRKGLHLRQYAELWLTVSILVGLFHLGTGYVFGFVNDWRGHGLKEAVLEDGSWLLVMVSLWLWIFSTQAADSKPEFIYTVFDGEPLALGFSGLPPLVVADVPLGPLGTLPLSVWLIGFFVGVALAVAGEGFAIGLIEIPTNGLVNVLSYTRIAAVLLAKAGMAFVVNVLVFGAYEHHGESHFMLSTTPDAVTAEYGAEAIVFGGLVHGGVAALLGGLLILVLGHALVLALGVTSAGLQAVRLEYVEFFGKFYEGGGEKYEPFGHRRTYTTED